MNTIYLKHTDDFVYGPCVGCIGYFDGIHIGHQALIKETVSRAKELSLPAIMITFDPDPWTVFKPESDLSHLTTMKDRERLAAYFGIDTLIVLSFTREFASLTVEQFHAVLSRIGICHLVCGFDFRYATKNSGDIHTLSSAPFSYSVVDSINEDDQKISSTRIEGLIKNGHIEDANVLLGYTYSIAGKVVHGFKRGSTLLSIPTANLSADKEYCLLSEGVYAGFVFVESIGYLAMINIGKNPTFDNKEMSIEAHLLDFHGDLYDKTLRFFFTNKLREVIPFDSIDSLKNQLFMDIRSVRNLHNSIDKCMEKMYDVWYNEKKK